MQHLTDLLRARFPETYTKLKRKRANTLNVSETNEINAYISGYIDAKGTAEVNPAIVINVMCGRLDRLFLYEESKTSN